VLYYLAETVAYGLIYSQYDYGIEMQPAAGSAGDPAVSSWRRFVYTFEDTQSQDPADNQQVSFDIANVTGGVIDPTWNSTDYQTVHNTLWTQIFGPSLSLFSGRFTCSDAKAYIRAFNPYSNSKPFAESGAPDWITNMGVACTGSNGAPQPCSTITEITSSRANWGRCYLPSLSPGAVGTNGRITGGTVTALATAAGGAYSTLFDSQFPPVVPTTSVNKMPVRTLQTVSGVRVDDVIDIQRRRRHKHFVTRVSQPTGALLPADESARVDEQLSSSDTSA